MLLHVIALFLLSISMSVTQYAVAILQERPGLSFSVQKAAGVAAGATLALTLLAVAKKARGALSECAARVGDIWNFGQQGWRNLVVALGAATGWHDRSRAQAHDGETGNVGSALVKNDEAYSAVTSSSTPTKADDLVALDQASLSTPITKQTEAVSVAKKREQRRRATIAKKILPQVRYFESLSGNKG